MLKKNKGTTVVIHLPQGYSTYKKEKGLTHDEMISLMWNSLSRQVLLNEEEERMVEKASQKIGVSREEVLKTGGLMYANTLSGSKKQGAHQDKRKVAAAQKAQKILDEMIALNDKTNDWWDKVLINQYTMDLYLKEHQKRLGSNSIKSTYIQNCLIENRSKIESHHKKHKIKEGHNQRASRHRWSLKQAEAIKEQVGELTRE